MKKQSIPRLVPNANELNLNTEERSPIDILRAQIDPWRDVTNGEVVGQVERTVTTPGQVAYWFGFVVPALDNYRYRLFLVEHGFDFYPVWISTDKGEQRLELRNEEEFCSELRARFADPKTTSIVRQLLAIATEARPPRAANDQ